MKRSRTVKATATIRTTPTKLFAALTDPKAISEWSGQRGEVQNRVGGKFEMFDGWVRGTVVAFIPGKSFSFTWRPSEWDLDWKDSFVECHLTETTAGTKVSLVHRGFPNAKEAANHKSGWKDYVFEPLKEYFTSKK